MKLLYLIKLETGEYSDYQYEPIELVTTQKQAIERTKFYQKTFNKPYDYIELELIDPTEKLGEQKMIEILCKICGKCEYINQINEEEWAKNHGKNCKKK